jgi:hypothetical protein
MYAPHPPGLWFLECPRILAERLFPKNHWYGNPTENQKVQVQFSCVDLNVDISGNVHTSGQHSE